LDRPADRVIEGVFVNALDYVVLVGTILGIAGYGIWRTRGRRTLDTFLKGEGKTRWFSIGLSVMATQASAVTFLSTPGQGYESGLGFVQVYFGMPIALIVIAIVFLPIYRRLNVYTAYEYLGQRFDKKTRLLGASIFLLQRGVGAGITIYAPAIVLSTVMGWRLDMTIVCSGLVVIVYTAMGGSDAVNVTQKQQLSVIFAGMIAAAVVLWSKLPAGLTLTDTLTLAGGFNKLQAVDFSFDVQKRYTFWSGVFGATFLMLAYFGADQSQVQRYISGASLRESRLGLMFNAVFKIPMQFFILMLGVLLFVFYLFHQPPVFFNQVAWKHHAEHGDRQQLQQLETSFNAAHEEQQHNLQAWIDARHSGNAQMESAARDAAKQAQEKIDSIRKQAAAAVDPKKQTSDSDYVFITFILGHLPHGLIGLLIAAFFAAALSAKAAELNALASTTTIDIYRHIIRTEAANSHYLIASKCFTVMWGMIAILFALFAAMAENLIQAVNIVGSIFYPVILGLFMAGFFLKWVGGTAVFWGALLAQILVIALYFSMNGYLWYNLIGCVACMLLSVLLQTVLPRSAHLTGPSFVE
jgi:solute:Na+ symporter, SSS family